MMRMDAIPPFTGKAKCPKCRAQNSFYVYNFADYNEEISICFACGYRLYKHDDEFETSQIKHKCQVRLYLG
jgi:uncharacterized metal-binding protein (TIGR02443 family)